MSEFPLYPNAVDATDEVVVSLRAENERRNRECVELRERIERLEGALRALYSETADYITINHLGPVHWNRSMQMARDALAPADGPALTASQQHTPHPDDIAVHRFAAAMKVKLAKKRGEGRGGWEDPSVCSVEDLWQWLDDHAREGDPIDVGNFAMMIWNRQQHTAGSGDGVADGRRPSEPASSIDAAQRRGYRDGEYWKEACRMFRARCSPEDCSRVAELRTMIETGELVVVRPALDQQSSVTGDGVADGRQRDIVAVDHEGKPVYAISDEEFRRMNPQPNATGDGVAGD